MQLMDHLWYLGEAAFGINGQCRYGTAILGCFRYCEILKWTINLIRKRQIRNSPYDRSNGRCFRHLDHTAQVSNIVDGT